MRAKLVNENYRYEEIENFISDLDDEIGSTMEMYLPDDEKVELYNLLKNGGKIKAIYGDSDEWSREKDIDWDEWIDRFETRKIQPLKAKGWEEFWVDEQGDEGREVILIKRRHTENKPLDENNNEFLGVVNESDDYCPECGAIVTDLDFCDECGYDPYEDDDEDDEDLDESKVPTTKKGKEKKFKQVMSDWKKGEQHIGKSKKTVPHTKAGQKQAVAIALSMSGQSNKK
jgi:hypothetical protein